jgi:GNAT superfamily N-acetyltransferase
VRRVGADAAIGRLAVAPDQQGRGLGTRLLGAAEAAAPDAARYVLFTGHASARTLDLYRRVGYAETHRAPGPTGVELVYLAKPNVAG